MTFRTSARSGPTLILNDGNIMPALGFGVFQIPGGEAFAAVSAALAAGYRSIDTASIYGNEEGVGRAIRESGVPRDRIFVTTKLWNADQGYDSTLKAFDASMDRLGLEYLDLYLIHWPVAEAGRFIDTFRAFQKLKADGRVRSLGVSNFTQANLTALIEAVGETPVVNQVELHPRFTQASLRNFHLSRAVATQAWSPLGGSRGSVLGEPVVVAIAAELGRTPAQVVIRWHLQLGNIVIPKSSDPARITANFDVFSFELTPDQMGRISALDDNTRIGPDPDAMR